MQDAITALWWHVGCRSRPLPRVWLHSLSHPTLLSHFTLKFISQEDTTNASPSQVVSVYPLQTSPHAPDLGDVIGFLLELHSRFQMTGPHSSLQTAFSLKHRQQGRTMDTCASRSHLPATSPPPRSGSLSFITSTLVLLGDSVALQIICLTPGFLVPWPSHFYWFLSPISLVVALNVDTLSDCITSLQHLRCRLKGWPSLTTTC